MRLQDKVAVITGASSGIGLAIAKKYVDEGAKVVLSDVNEESGQQAAAEIGNGAVFYRCDVSNSSEVDALVDFAAKTFGKVDIMVNNAGIGGLGGVTDATDATWSKIIGINLSGVFYGCRAAAKYMQENAIKGSIINMASILGSVGFEGAIAYSAAKGGVVNLTRAGGLDLAKTGVRMNAIAPGFIETAMTHDLLLTEFGDMVKARTPMGYVGEPEDIANAALYLASDESKYVTGEILHVDGGWRAQ